MAVTRQHEHPLGDWIVDSVAELDSIQQKVHGTEAYITAEQVWVKWNAYTSTWRVLTLGIVPVAGMDPED